MTTARLLGLINATFIQNETLSPTAFMQEQLPISSEQSFFNLMLYMGVLVGCMATLFFLKKLVDFDDRKPGGVANRGSILRFLFLGTRGYYCTDNDSDIELDEERLDQRPF